MSGLVDVHEDSKQKLYLLSKGWSECSLEAGDYCFEFRSVTVGIEAKSGIDFTNSWVEKQRGIRRLTEQVRRLKDCFDIPVLLYGNGLTATSDGYTTSTGYGDRQEIPWVRIAHTLVSYQSQGIVCLPYNEYGVGRAHAVLAFQKWCQKTYHSGSYLAPAAKHLIDPRVYMLTAIPGVSEKRAWALVKHFRSIKVVTEASIEDLRKVKDIGEVVAEKIYNTINCGG